MGYTDNPFAPVTQDERVVMNHLRTLLNRISPSVQQAILSNLTSTDVPQLTNWTTQRETNDPVPDSVHLVGLSKYPPADGILDLSTEPGSGPVDLYSETDSVGVAIEGKTKESLQEEQLSRYITELNADSYTTVSWSDLYRTLSEHRIDMGPYPAGLTNEFLEYLEQIDLHKPHRVAKYVWGDGEGEKQIRVEENEGGLSVIWRAKAAGGQGKQDERVLSWDEFCKLFKDIENRHSQGLVRRVFVNLEPPTQQPELDGDTIIGEINPVREEVSNEHFLRLNYHGDDKALKLRTVRNSKGGTVGSPLTPGRDQWVWYTEKKELTKLLKPQHLPGFDREFRELLFLERDHDRVKSQLW